jgi:hypothetical protein
MILAIRYVVHVVFEAGVAEHVVDHLARITVADLEGCAHPLRDIVCWPLTIILQCETAPWDVSERRPINGIVQVLVVLERCRRWGTVASDRPQLHNCIDLGRRQLDFAVKKVSRFELDAVSVWIPVVRLGR